MDIQKKIQYLQKTIDAWVNYLDEIDESSDFSELVISKIKEHEKELKSVRKKYPEEFLK